MKILSLAALVVALAMARHEQEELRGRHWHHKHIPSYEDVLDRDYEQNKEYLYEYNGQLMTGIPQSSKQHSATRVQALVKLIFKTPRKAMLKMEKIRFGYFNDKVTTPRYVQDFDLFEQVPIDEDKNQVLSLPVEFAFEQGLVQDVYFTEQEQPWSANMKRAVLNLLQVNVNKQRRTDVDELKRNRFEERSFEMRSLEDNEKRTNFFTVMENTLEGECETAYTMIKTDKADEVNVTKTINFAECHRRPDIRYNYRFQDFCPSCQANYNYKAQDRVLKASTVINQLVKIGQSNEVLIKKAETESFYTFTPFTAESNVIQTYVITNIKLVKKQEIEDKQILRHELPIKSDSGLISTVDWDVAKEKFFLEGEEQFQETTPYSNIKDKTEFIKSIVQKLVHYMHENVEEEAPRQFVRLIKVMRLLKKADVEKVMHEFVHKQAEDFTREEHQKIKSILVDALALSGTQPAIEYLVEQIEQRHINPLKASFVIKKMQSVRVISEKMIQQLWKLTEEKYCKESPVTICQSAYLTIGSLLNGLCEPKLDKLAVTFKKDKPKLCTRQTKQQWTEKLVQRFEQCQSDVCRVTVLKAIANAGLDESINRLEKIIKNRSLSELVRVEAVLALRQLVELMPRRVEKLLLPVFMNKRETAVVRMAALHKIMHTQPERFVLDQLTRSLLQEQNTQVAAFVYTNMQEYANSTNPCEQRMADDLKLSLRHASYLPVDRWINKSKFLRQQMYSQQYDTGYWIDYNNLWSNNTILPKDIAATLQLKMGQQWNRNAFTIGFTQQNIEQFLRQAVRKYSHNLQKMPNSLSDIVESSWSSEETSPKFRKQLDEIFDNLSIEERENDKQSQEEKQSLALMYIRLLNQDYAFLPISKEMLPESLLDILSTNDLSMKKLAKAAERMLKDTEIDLPFDVQTATMVHEMSHKIPTTIGMPLLSNTKSPLVAQARGHLKVKLDRQTNKAVIELVEFKPSSVLTIVQKIEIWSPIVNTGLKLLSQQKIYAPMSIKLEAQLKNEQPIIKLAVKPTDKKFDFIRIQSRPVTLVKIWPKKLVQYQEPEEKTIQGDDWTRVDQSKSTFGENVFGIKFTTYKQWHKLPAQHVTGTPLPLLAGPNKLVVRVEPGLSMPKEIELTATSSMFNRLVKSSMKPEFERFYVDKSDEWLNDDSSLSESRERQNNERKSSERYYKQYETTEPTQHQLELTVEGKGSSIERRAQMTVGCKLESQSSKAGKCELIVKRTPVPELEEREWQLVSTVEFLYPETARTVDDISSEKKMMVRVKTHWGQDKQVDVKLVGEQSRVMERLIERSMYRQHSKISSKKSLFSPVAQHEQMAQLSMLDEYKVDVDYVNIDPSVKNATEKVLDFIKHYYYAQTDIDHQPEEPERQGQLRLRINIDPLNRRYVNLTVQMPHEKVIVTDMPLPMQFNGFNMKQSMKRSPKSFYELLSNQITDYKTCQVRDDRIKTFNKVQYMAPVSTCYSLVAKDCTRQSKFAVLVKRISEQSEEKQLKIVSEDVELIVTPNSEGQLEYMLNGDRKNVRELQQILRHKTHEILSVTQDEAGYARIALPEAGIRVYFDAYALNVKASPYNRLCGLCGEIDEEECQLKDADDNCVDVNSKQQLKRFFNSFVLRNDECSEQQQRYYNDEDKYEYEPLQWQEQQSIDSDDINNIEAEYKSEVEPRGRTRVIEQLHEVCFSKQAVPKCPTNTQPKEYEQAAVKVVYTCLARNDFETEEYLREARLDRIVEQVQQLSASFTQSEKVPSMCEKIQY